MGALHEKLALREYPRLTRHDFASMFETNEFNGILIARRFNHSPLRESLLMDVASMVHYDENTVTTPMGSIVSYPFLHWCGGVFDGDGCVKAGRSSSLIQVIQNSPHVQY